MANRPTADRWGAEAAVKKSALPAQSRLIIYTLLTHVTNGTLVVPAKYAPTFSALVEQTGLARGTLSKYLNQLEDNGWLKRNRPSKQQAMQGHQRTGYEVTPPVHLLNQFESRTGSRAEPADEEPQVRASSGDEPVREANQSGSGAEHIPMYPSASSPTEKKHRGGSGGKSRGTNRATARPADFKITDQMRGWAAEKTPLVDIEFETEQFLDHHDGKKKSKFVDWTRAWQTWMRNAQKWAAERNGQRRTTGAVTNPNYDDEEYSRGW